MARASPPPTSPSGSSESHSDQESNRSDVRAAPTAASASTTFSAPREKKRRRPALACEQCRRRKVRCDRLNPCGPCSKTEPSQCTYAPTHVPAVRGSRRSQITKGDVRQELVNIAPQRSLDLRPAVSRQVPPPPPVPEEIDGAIGGIRDVVHFSSGPSSVLTPSADGTLSDPGHHVEALREKVLELHAKIEGVEKLHDTSSIPKNIVRGYVHHQRKGGIAKARYFSQGHWMHGAWLYPMELSILVHAENTKDELYWILLRCKDLARKIKAQRFQPLSSSHLGRSLPARALADQLIETYLRTFEGPYRIVHIPSFRAEYERMWENREAASNAFVMQAQLCMALGAALYDETFTMRKQAMNWVYEAQVWVAMPPEKDRLTYMGMQNLCLVTLARGVCSLGPDLAWIGAGQLVRTALFMGLHREPRQLANMTTFRAEMRRRLWATVMELDLQVCVDAGGRPTITDADYDTMPPANLDDEQLTDTTDMERQPSPSLDVPSQTSVQILLQQTHRLRLAILRRVSDPRGETPYELTLQLNSQLTKACRHLSKAMEALRTASVKRAFLGVSVINQFHVSHAELILYRCFHTLHQPVIMRSLEDPRFYFSKKMYLDSALKLAHVLHITPADRGRTQATMSGPELDFDRYITNASGMARNTIVQTLWGLGLRLIHQGEDSSLSLGYFPTGNSGEDMRGYIEKAKEWTRNRIRAGETGVKIHCFAAAAIAHSEKLEAGADASAIQEAILEHATIASKEGYELLKELAIREGVPLPDENGIGAVQTDAPGYHVAAPALFEDGVSLFRTDMFSAGGDGMDWMADWSWDGVADFSWTTPAPQMGFQPMPHDQSQAMMQPPIG